MQRSKKQERAPHDIRLNAHQYDAFVAALDAPAKPRPRLEKLLTALSVLEQDDPLHK